MELQHVKHGLHYYIWTKTIICVKYVWVPELKTVTPIIERHVRQSLHGQAALLWCAYALCSDK